MSSLQVKSATRAIEILEFFKIEDGKLAEIEAFLSRPPYGMLSGWSTWEDGMSDKIQDVTGYRER